MWQTQVQTIKYVINDTKRKKRNKLHWYFIQLHPLIWIFKQFWRPKWFWQNYCHKKSTHLDHSYLKYALVDLRFFQPFDSEICIALTFIVIMFIFIVIVFTFISYDQFNLLLECSSAWIVAILLILRSSTIIKINIW